ncbi:hypothetical protein MPL3356_60485 [Mesorhizobium plurifarium]|uniref:Uncharacterized protein n=1 Tax=Mesorhizobium plurifarium TaxID=69974 RepID=A0A090EEW8_MESPL|nr:hypothetical protein MPL3356_60485 [Mesorhizobium plurifarium]
MDRTDLERIAALIELSDPQKAAEIRARLAEADDGRREGLNISVGIAWRLQKFDGEFATNKRPVEVIEGVDTL